MGICNTSRFFRAVAGGTRRREKSRGPCCFLALTNHEFRSTRFSGRPHPLSPPKFGPVRLCIANPRERSRPRRPTAKPAHIIFDTGHNVSGSYGIFTSLAVETGLLASRAILEFLQGKLSYEDDVKITCFRKSNGAKLPSVSLADIAKCCPLDVPEEKILKALNFTKTAADKAVAHITLAPPEPENGDVEFYRISCRTIRSAMERHLYKELDLPSPRRLCPS